ncbi:MAG: hypothetical protein HQL39_01570 [Alphaproteobacteria bacterium]|nr:hypothetical protein [Alphaproteobacteria bacterium]
MIQRERMATSALKLAVFTKPNLLIVDELRCTPPRQHDGVVATAILDRRLRHSQVLAGRRRHFHWPPAFPA